MVEVEVHPQGRRIDGRHQRAGVVGMAEGGAGMVDGQVEVLHGEHHRGVGAQSGEFLQGQGGPGPHGAGDVLDGCDG